MEFKGYNDYSVEVYRAGQCLGTFQSVTNINLLALWLCIHFIYWKWTSIRVFHRDSKTFIGEYARNSSIPSKPLL
jgi:hypothetical protein